VDRQSAIGNIICTTTTAALPHFSVVSASLILATAWGSAICAGVFYLRPYHTHCRPFVTHTAVKNYKKIIIKYCSTYTLHKQ